MSESLRLHEVQRLPTFGARAVAPFVCDGHTYLAVPQLAQDIAGQQPSMMLGDSDTDMPVYRWESHGPRHGPQGGRFVEHQRLAVPGGEDAEFFEIGARRFLATASLRRGAGPYRMDPGSALFEWHDGRFEPFQSFATFAAKQWTHVAFGTRHFLVLAQGVTVHDGNAGANMRSTVFEWNGERFDALQELPSAWGYNACGFEIGGAALLAYADHAEPSRLFAWTGSAFEALQTLDGKSGRAFCRFDANGHEWLAFANLLGESLLYRWAGTGFVLHQTLSGPGGREFEWLPDGRGGGHLVQVNFIHGSREAPRPVLESFVHGWTGERFEVVARFGTSGGTDAAAFKVDGVRYLAVSNSLDASLRFRTDTCIYRIETD